MREGLDPRDLIIEAQRISTVKQDYIPHSRELKFAARPSAGQLAAQAAQVATVRADNGTEEADAAWFAERFPGAVKPARPVPAETLLNFGRHHFEINALANDQLAEHLSIPGGFYDKLREEHPKLLTTTVNTLLQARPQDERRMIRTLDNKVRAVLSNIYEPLDNYDLLRYLMPMFSPKGAVTSDGIPIRPLLGPDGQPLKVIWASCNITEQNIYIKLIAPQIRTELKVGTVLRAGALIKNSEVGLGLIGVIPFYEVRKCTNGAFITEYGNTRRHVGRAKIGNGGGNDAEKYFSDETKRHRDQTFFMEMGDTLRGTLTQDVFNKMLNPIRESMGIPIVDPIGAIEAVTKRYSLADKELDGILNYMVQGGDLSLWGLSNAVTRYSQDVESYDRATELEGVGGSMLVLPSSDRKSIAEATRSRKYKASGVAFSNN